MSAPKQDPIEEIIESPLKEVLVKGFAELYKQRPAFPIEFFGKWLKNYSQGQQRQKELESTRTQKEERVAQQERKNAEKGAKQNDLIVQKNKKISQIDEQFNAHISKTNYLHDLLAEYLPTEVEKSCHERGVQLTGCYIGELKHRPKKLEQHNFEPGAQFDTQNPKIIEYLGATKSHHFMLGQILPNETGKTYEVFKEEEPPAEEPEEGKTAKPKHKYLYVPQVQRDQKIYQFRFPKLGAYACFPLKVKSCLYTQTFDKAIGDYKSFVKNKEEVEKQYNQKLQEAKASYEQAKRKYEEHQGNEEDAQFVADHANLQQQFKKNEAAFKEIESTPPVIEPFRYDTKNKQYVVAIDTMGHDSQIPDQVLNYLEKKVDHFRVQWEEKEYKMLLDDVLLFLEEEGGLQGMDNYFKDQQKGFISSTEHQIKEQFANKEKEAEYELTQLKVGKFFKILQEQPYLNSLNAYLHYHIPKYTEIIQIALMLLGYKKQDINLPRSNILDHRKWIQKQSVQKLLVSLEKYELRRDQSNTVQSEYKINKLLQRLEKVDGEAVGRYNSWLFGFLCNLKQICWARIQCRDAKIQAYEAKVKAKNDRDTEIIKYQQEMEKSLQTAKAELTQEALPTFNEQDWKKTYINQNVRPEPLAVEQLKQFLDIE